MDIYNYPTYYDIAFGSVNAKEQVDCFEEIANKHSMIKVKSFLDICCGPSPQLLEIARRGYKTIGLDLSPQMLQYLSEKAKKEGLKIFTKHGDMFRFRFREKVDFAFIMQGSLAAKSNQEFLRHLDCVASSLNKGGLYLIQNKRMQWSKIRVSKGTFQKDGIIVNAKVSYRWKNTVGQIYERVSTYTVNDHGKEEKFVLSEDLKFIAPQEFKALIDLNGKFSFLGWWQWDGDSSNLGESLDNVKNSDLGNIVLLRRK